MNYTIRQRLKATDEWRPYPLSDREAVAPHLRAVGQERAPVVSHGHPGDGPHQGVGHLGGDLPGQEGVLPIHTSEQVREQIEMHREDPSPKELAIGADEGVSVRGFRWLQLEVLSTGLSLISLVQSALYPPAPAGGRFDPWLGWSFGTPLAPDLWATEGAVRLRSDRDHGV